MTYADLLIKIAKALFGRKDRLRDLNRQKSDRVASFLDEIASLFTRIATSLRKGERPTSDCAQLGLTQYFLSDMECEKLGFQELKELELLVGHGMNLPMTLVEMICDSPNSLLIDVEDVADIDFSTERLDSAYQRIARSWRVERELPMATKLNHKVEPELRKLEEVAGTFRALATFIRATA
jgi:hypothetical protein